MIFIKKSAVVLSIAAACGILISIATQAHMSALAAVKARTGAILIPGHLAVVVGGTSGIGEGIALRLARAQASVWIVGRNEEQGQAVVARMKQLGNPAGKYAFVRCDATLMVRLFFVTL
jgi:NADP-dependent 3-hydroxy acid dehydrogenase YdfG